MLFVGYNDLVNVHPIAALSGNTVLVNLYVKYMR